MSSRSRLRALLFAVLGLAPAPAMASPQGPRPQPTAQAQPQASSSSTQESVAAPTPTWRFHRSDKPIKVVVLAGSIGAYPNQPYGRQLEHICENIEVRNLSRTGQGARALKAHFRREVLENPRLRTRPPDTEFWLVYGGGLNSVGNPNSTNDQASRLFSLAHDADFRVVALSLTPWGDLRDRRWRGFQGVRRRRATQKVVDHVFGRLTPEQALGPLARRRSASNEWTQHELPDIAVDLYDSPLRDHDAAVQDIDAMRTEIAADPAWIRQHARLPPSQRRAQLEADVRTAMDLPRWFMKREFRAFDHVHPNRDGHRVIAETICPKLPATWGCQCGRPE